MPKYENPLYDPDQVSQFLASLAPAPTPKPESNTDAALRTVGDMGASFGQGAGELVRGVGTFFGGSHSDIAEAGGLAADYWQDAKSGKLKAKEQAFGEIMADPNKSGWDAAGHVLTNPYLASSMVASSAPAMAVGMGAGGLIGRAMVGAGMMTDAAGTLTTMGTRVAGGIGEGLSMVPNAYEATKGSGAASAAELALGIVTNMITPGNVAGAGVRKMTGASEQVLESALNKSVGRRVGTAILGEASQEGLQSFGQEITEQLGRGEAIDLNAAGKQTAVGAVLGGVMGGALHPIVGEGAPTNADALAARQAALAANPNNPVLQAEVAVEQAKANQEVAPTSVGDLKVRAVEANLAAARDPANRELRDAADMATAAVALHVAGADGVRVAADTTLAATQQAIQDAPDLDTALTAFGRGDQASSTLRTTAVGIENTVRALDPNTPEVSHLYDESTAEIQTPEQALKLKLAELRVQTQEVKLAAEIAKVQKAETPLPTIDAARLPDFVEVQPAGSTTDQVRATDAAYRAAMEARGETPASAARLASRFARTPESWAPIANNTGGNYSPEVQAYARALIAHSKGETDVKEISYPDSAEAPLPTINPDMANAAPVSAARGYTVQENAVRPGSFYVFDQNGDEYDSYSGNGAEQDAHAAAATMNRNLANARAYADAKVPEPAAPAAPAARTEHPRIAQARQDMSSFGYSSDVIGNMEAMPTHELRNEMHDLTTSPDRRRFAHALLEHRDRADVMPAAAFDAREDALMRGLAERPNQTTTTHRQVLSNMRNVDENSLRAWANAPSHNSFGLARVALAFRQGAHLGNVDVAEPGRTAQPAARPVADLVREAAAEVEAEAAVTGRARPRTSDVARTPIQSFTARAERARANGTLDKLGRFWKSLMNKEGQRTLPPVDMSDKLNEARAAVAAGRAIPQAVLTAMMDRYNAALKEQARAWATAHNKPFNEATWINPIEDIAPDSMGAHAGLRTHLYGLGRGENNPYAVNPGSRRVMFNANYGIHAVDLRDAPGSGDLAYRLAAQVAHLRGKGFFSDATLLTVNNLRRQLQSMSADTLFGPGTINPLEGPNAAGPQGVPEMVWDASTPTQKIGLNALRAAHSISENRGRGAGFTAGRFTENLVFDRQGRIVAYTDPRTPNGFPRGTIVSDTMLKAKVGEPVSTPAGRTVRPYETDGRGYGGVGADTARLAILNNTILNEIENDPDKAIPSWIKTVAAKQGKKMGGWFFSEAAPVEGTTGAPVTAEDAAARVDAMLGEPVSKLLRDAGIITFVQTQDELTGKTFSDSAGRIQGATSPDGKITLVLDNLTDSSFDAVLQHEGLHATLKTFLGQSTYDALMTRLDTLLQAGEGAQWAKDANARVPANTPEANRLEEVAAYAVELAAKGAPDSNPLVRWAKDFMSSLRAAIIKSKFVPESLRVWAINNVQPADLQKLAVAGLRARAVGAQGGTFKTSQGASFGVPKQGSTTVQGIHFSNSQRDTLSTQAYGKGTKGAEARRLSEPENADIQGRTHFYVDEGKGVQPEAGVGGYGHMVQLNNLYNLGEDALKLRNVDPSVTERAVMKEGFDGYYSPGVDGKQGTAVVLGAHEIPTEPYVAGTNVSEPAKKVADTYAQNLRKSKFPGGEMQANEWAVAIKGTEFDTPAVQEALKEREGQMIYRDDLPRFNAGYRFSITQQQAIQTAPVNPALPTELNVLSNAQRGAGRVLEKARALLQQKHVAIARVQSLAKITAENIKLSTIGALDRMGSIVMNLEKELVDKPLAKIEALLHATGMTPDEAADSINDYVMHKHVQEFNESMAQINPAKYDAAGEYLGGFDDAHPGSGIKTDFANAYVADVVDRAANGDAKATAVLEAAKVHDKMIHDLQDYAVRQGLETQEMIDMWRDKYANYTPFNRDLDTDENLSIGGGAGGQGLSLRAGISRRAMGSSAKIIPPLISLTQFGMKTIQRGENAVVARTILDFAREFTPMYQDRSHNMKPMWKVETVPNQRVIKKVNVYNVRLADGSLSPEFYNRQQARDYANMKEASWRTLNPNAAAPSGITVERLGDEPQSRVIVQPVPNYLSEPNVFSIPENGETKFMVFDPESKDGMAILNALKGTAVHGSTLNTINKVLGVTGIRMFSKWVVATSTGFNPAFMPFNAVRDVLGAMISSNADKIPGWNASDSMAVAKEFPGAMQQIWSYLKADFVATNSNNVAAPVPKAGSYAEWYKLTEENGGLTGISQGITDTESATTKIRRLFGQDVLSAPVNETEANDLITKAAGFMVKVGDAFHNFGEGQTTTPLLGVISRNVVSGVARMNAAGEAATRTIAFKHAVERYEAAGKTREEALKLAAVFAKNISTNFQRKGEISSLINSMYPFFSAAVQGSSRLAEVMFEKYTYNKTVKGQVLLDQKTRLTKTGKVVLASLPALGVVQALAMFAAGLKDDDIPQQIKDRAFIVPLGDGNYIAIPMPHGFNTIMNFGREMTDAVLYPKRWASHVGKATFGQLGAFNPLGSAGNWLTDLAPAVADPFIQYSTNTDAFGRPIAKENVNAAAPTPGFTRAKEGASKTGRVISEAINSLTGGNQDQSGFMSPTPDQIDFIFGQVGGGVGREAGKLVGTAGAAKDIAMGNEREPVPSYKLPLIGRVYGSTSEPVAVRSKLFSIRTELNENYARYKGLKERGDTQAANDFWDEHPELALRNSVESFVRKDAKQRKNRALARSNEEIGEVNRITGQQDARISDLVTRYNEITN